MDWVTVIAIVLACFLVPVIAGAIVEGVAEAFAWIASRVQEYSHKRDSRR